MNGNICGKLGLFSSLVHGNISIEQITFLGKMCHSVKYNVVSCNLWYDYDDCVEIDLNGIEELNARSFWSGVLSLFLDYLY